MDLIQLDVRLTNRHTQQEHKKGQNQPTRFVLSSSGRDLDRRIIRDCLGGLWVLSLCLSLMCCFV